MVLQGVKRTIQPLGVGYANSPKKAKMGGGGMWRFPQYTPAWLCSNNLCEVIPSLYAYYPPFVPDPLVHSRHLLPHRPKLIHQFQQSSILIFGP